MCNPRTLPKQPGCPALSKPSTVNESFCTGEQRRQSLCGEISVLGSIWDLKEMRSWKFRQNRKEPLGSLLHPQQVCWGHSAGRQGKCVRGEWHLQRQLGQEAGRNCRTSMSQSAAPGTRGSKEHSEGSVCLGGTLLQGTWGSWQKTSWAWVSREPLEH